MNGTRAREYTIWNTPFMVLLRGRIGPAKPGQRLDPLAPVKESSLPEPAKALIAKVAKQTRLWKHERQEIAEEMVAHFADGIESGCPVDDVIASFGDIRKAAKLLRRAKKRNRPLWWKLTRGSIQAIACFVLVYIGLFAFFFIGRPTPTVDYLPRLNAVAASAPPSECAWPIYRQAWTDAGSAKIDASQFLFDESRRAARHVFATDDPDQAAARALLKEHAKLIDAMRAAGAKRYLGLVVGPAGSFKPDDALTLGIDNVPGSDKWGAVDRLHDTLIAVLLPHLARLRSMESLLALDMEDAAAQNDSQRVLTDYSAILGMVRHAREHSFLVNQLVAWGMVDLADQRLAWILQLQPHVLDGQQIAILHQMATTRELYTLDATWEFDNLLDIIQHIYTDSGSGNGRLTAEGLRSMATYRAVGGNHEPPDLLDTPQGLAVFVLMAAAVSSRRDSTANVNRYWNLVQEDLSRPAWEQLSRPFDSSVYLDKIKQSLGRNVDLLPLYMCPPYLDRAAHSMINARAIHESLMVALALDVYRLQTGHYPGTLSELVPQYLLEVPLDLSTGLPLLYKLKDGKPLIYGRGLDGKDDGGVWVQDKRYPWPSGPWPNVPTTGDWVLYPEPAPTEAASQ